MGHAYPEIKERQSYIEKVIKAEEESFGRTLDRGIEIFEQKVKQVQKAGETVFPGKDAFVLHDTYGFPLDLTQLMAEEKNLTVDEKAFDKEMALQRERSSKDRNAVYETIHVSDDQGASEFVGYDQDAFKTNVVHYEDGKIIIKKHTVLCRIRWTGWRTVA